ncbi:MULTISPECIES: putative T7SS-secreted protein [unclassified Streptomyces]|uniref:putative T7SS-secreted protein n=1 Tax=unclassified Streptomyces TaxID=2593676 RepID=UPI00278C71B5|nr:MULTISPECIES: hypothetical protein [unclassified Streptomyces]
MAELGETSDARDLVPGDPDGVLSTAQSMLAYGDTLIEAGEGLAKVDTEEGWRGPAGDAFRDRFHGEPKKWIEAGRDFHTAGHAFYDYGHTLSASRRRP